MPNKLDSYTLVIGRWKIPNRPLETATFRVNDPMNSNKLLNFVRSKD